MRDEHPLDVELRQHAQRRQEALLIPGYNRGLFTRERWLEVEDAMWELYRTGIAHKPSFVNAIAEEAYAIASAGL